MANIVMKRHPNGKYCRIPIEERFLKYVMPEPNTGCWLWIGFTNHGGYGTISSKNDKRFNKNSSAHRLSYTLYKGEIPNGMFVCHTCDVTSCVNPDHLYLGTPQDNMDDKMRRGRHKFKPYKRQVTDEEIKEIINSPLPQKIIAAKYKICQQRVSQLKLSDYNEATVIIERIEIKKL